MSLISPPLVSTPTPDGAPRPGARRPSRFGLYRRALGRQIGRGLVLGLVGGGAYLAGRQDQRDQAVRQARSGGQSDTRLDSWSSTAEDAIRSTLVGLRSGVSFGVSAARTARDSLATARERASLATARERARQGVLLGGVPMPASAIARAALAEAEGLSPMTMDSLSLEQDLAEAQRSAGGPSTLEQDLAEAELNAVPDLALGEPPVETAPSTRELPVETAPSTRELPVETAPSTRELPVPPAPASVLRSVTAPRVAPAVPVAAGGSLSRMLAWSQADDATPDLSPLLLPGSPIARRAAMAATPSRRPRQ